MKIYYLFFLLILIQLNLVNNQDLNQPTNDNPLNRDFEKDMEELDLSGLEDDIENIEEIAYKDSYTYVTQIYIYVRIDGDYSIYKSHSNLMKLGEKYMTLLQNAMLNVQLKKNGIGEFICYYQKKDITENLATYFLIQKEIDYIQIGFEKRFPEGRISPIVDAEKRKTSSENIKDEL
ncbi:conserved Plasmodium protein, unknown function [Plasmodium berghei]|uniref:Uncharacterized protein n=2 Tax=Plasmodium berghei TaxID=5821 RepID=A0A509AFT2_PLABA|nr:conserved Plasmodium protein, unknown function [Plasmodium berghei ANKA]CXI01172.1 conserved Plasmodium protein, unknown function [Plasmodium berghei]SCL91789.1 conserved Plasmodium protein, unknown function [Plasmodium berghei]SCM15532.1 conserved Plasmodium protein, unknown function [Plasmodium berghei]SCM17324.1 conserved Plasmodium protein, unknown function [Plasmodium berghei]SCN22542.1 conserved Plasmodium protein, unknown function [Plasmodium berghei]|eukprot:XP_034420130.1 conserved Plasmodium protein, unknown function [Plasmodium berghei ANKA]